MWRNCKCTNSSAGNNECFWNYFFRKSMNESVALPEKRLQHPAAVDVSWTASIRIKHCTFHCLSYNAGKPSYLLYSTKLFNLCVRTMLQNWHESLNKLGCFFRRFRFSVIKQTFSLNDITNCVLYSEKRASLAQRREHIWERLYIHTFIKRPNSLETRAQKSQSNAFYIFMNVITEWLLAKHWRMKSNIRNLATLNNMAERAASRRCLYIYIAPVIFTLLRTGVWYSG